MSVLPFRRPDRLPVRKAAKSRRGPRPGVPRLAVLRYAGPAATGPAIAIVREFPTEADPEDWERSGPLVIIPAADVEALIERLRAIAKVVQE